MRKIKELDMTNITHGFIQQKYEWVEIKRVEIWRKKAKKKKRHIKGKLATCNSNESDESDDELVE